MQFRIRTEVADDALSELMNDHATRCRKFLTAAHRDVVMAEQRRKRRRQTHRNETSTRFTAWITPLARKVPAVAGKNDGHPAVTARVAPVAVNLEGARFERPVDSAFRAISTGDVCAVLLDPKRI